MNRLIVLAAYLLGAAAFVHAEENQAGTKPERIQLENGVTLLLAPYPEAKTVAVESFYRVGFCDEPAGMIQAAHLMEHLLCQAATKSYGPGESFAQLRKMGLANAETLPTLTHFDFTAPSSELGTILKIEAERLTSLKITSDLISIEADKCDEETQYVYKVPESGMVKHAFMALFQFWNHGAAEVRVRGGLDQIPVDKLESFYRERYRPDQLTLAIVGGFQKADAIKLAREHFAAIPSEKRAKRSISWNSFATPARVTWDAEVHAVCLYAPPPPDPNSRWLLSLWGTAFLQKLATHSELRELSNMTFATNSTWPVGELPFFVYATAKRAEHLPRIETIIRELLSQAPTQLAGDLAQMRLFAGNMNGSPIPDWKEIQSQAKAFAKTAGRPEEDTIPLTMLNVALQWGLRELAGAGIEGFIPNENNLRELLQKVLDPAGFRVVILGPPPSVEMGP